MIPIALNACHKLCHNAGRIKPSPNGEPKYMLEARNYQSQLLNSSHREGRRAKDSKY
jgi:hypothetical protein